MLTPEFIGNILLAALLGGILGVERDLTGRAAGLRTNLLIAVSSCLFTMLSVRAFGSLGNASSLVAAQIVTGVGFLGAGALIHHKNHVVGLTTAADIWLVAAIGMVVGVQWYGIAVFVALFVVSSLWVLAPVSHWLERKAGTRMRSVGLSAFLDAEINGTSRLRTRRPSARMRRRRR